MVKEVFDIVRKAGGTKKNYDSKDTTPVNIPTLKGGALRQSH